MNGSDKFVMKFENVYFINGTAYAGKSTIVKLLAEKYDGIISDENHVLIMLADPNISVQRFFERPDKEKQFLYQLLLKEDNPEQAIINFRECLKRINLQERYMMFQKSGFSVITRDENRSIEETFSLVEEVFHLN